MRWEHGSARPRAEKLSRRSPHGRGVPRENRLDARLRQKLLLTGWLLFPILVFAGLVGWIFVTKGAPKAMNEPPVGAGAGDTGGANAIGEMLSGRDPNAVERANIARRQNLPVDPFWWPGGTEVVVDAPGAGQVSIGWLDPESSVMRAVALRRERPDGSVWSRVMVENRPPEGAPIFVSTTGLLQRIQSGRQEVTDDGGELLLPRAVRPVDTTGVPASDPIRVELTVESE